MEKREIIIGLGILVILLALAGTVSAHPSSGCTPSNCHNFDGNFFYNTHKFDGISAPTASTSCPKCHVNPPGDMSMTSSGQNYSSIHRYNDSILASEMLSAPACYNCHEDVNNNDFTKLSGTPTYLTSTTCEACHKTKYDNWTNTLHRVMLTPKDKAMAMGLPEPEVSWANISYVIVTKFEFAYLNTTGYFPAQNDAYETETEEWVNSSHAGGAYGTCGSCHNTNWNPSGDNTSLPGFYGNFSEPGIACERCHGAAGNGHQVVVDYSGDQCLECHGGSRHGTGWENGAHAPPPYEIGSNCMFCHSSFDQYKNQNVTEENATGVSCGVCHNIHDMTDEKYAETFSEGIFNAATWSEVADSKLSFFNATASFMSLTGGSTGTLTAGNDIFDTLVSPALLYPGTDTSRKDASYGTEPINVTGPVSEVLCSMCHYRHGLAHTAEVNLTHSRMNYEQIDWATCTDCHMAGTNAIVGKDMMKMHANDPLTPNSCGGTTKCHTTSAQDLNKSSHSIVPIINEWNQSLHNDKINGGFFENGTSPRERASSCSKCHSPVNWNPANETSIVGANAFKGITCQVCHNIHDMGDWLKKTMAMFGTPKAYAWYNRDAVVAATDSEGVPTRYRANYSMMANTTELCGNCHANIREGRSAPGWASDTATTPIRPHGFPAKDIFEGSVKQTTFDFECIDCHMAKKITDPTNLTEKVLPDSQKVTGHSFKVNVPLLQNDTCAECHDVGDISTRIEVIQADTHEKWNATNITVMNALATINAFSGPKNLSRDLIAEAYWNLRMVSSDESWGVHNPNGTNKLLDNATALANESLTKLGEAQKTITVSPSTATLAINGTQVFNAMALDQNGDPMSEITIVWASNNTAVGNVSPITATTDVSGGATTTFTAGAAGIAMITANNDTVEGSANVTVTVSPAPPTLTITVSPPTATLAINETQIFNATTLDRNGTPISGITIVWESNNTAVGNVSPITATTDVSGGATTTFTAGAEGIAIVNATNGTVSGSANVNVTTVTPPTNVTIAIRTIEKESLHLGESTNITVDISSNISQALNLREIIPAGWNLTRVTDDADAFKSSTNEWIWFDVKPGIHRTVIYRLTAPDNASIGTYHNNGTISSSTGVIAVVTGDNTITLDIIAFYRRLGSDSDKVETTDVLTAVEDWRNNTVPAGFERAITTQEVLALIEEWIVS